MDRDSWEPQKELTVLGERSTFPPKVEQMAASVSATQLPHNSSHELLRVPEEHQRSIEIVERIVDAGKAGAHAALDHHYGVGLVHVENRHAKNRAALIGAGGGPGDVVVADSEINCGT